MMVQNQSLMGEGSAIPTDPRTQPNFIQPTSSPQKITKTYGSQEKGHSVPSTSIPLLTKFPYELSIRNPSKETPNESSSQGTTSGVDPRCKETMRDNIAQTRFENVSKLSNDSLLARGNTLRSDEDRLKLNELMELWRLMLLMHDEDITTGLMYQNDDEVTDLLWMLRCLRSRLKALKTLKGLLSESQLAERLQAEEQEKFIIEEKATLFIELLEQRRKHFTAKREEDKRNKPPTKTQHKKIMITYLNNMEGWKHKDLKSKDLKSKDLKSKDFDSIKELFDKAFTMQKVDEDKDIVELQSPMEVISNEEEVAIDVAPLATKVFSQMLKSFTREDLEDLYKLVKAKYESTRPVEDLDLVLWNDLKTILQSGIIYMLVEKRYPLTPPTITDMLNKKLQGRIVEIKSLLNAASITAALIDVNAAQSKLVLLENFNENYSMCLRLLVKLQLSVQSYYC
ncbi:hypothetical protein Tco_0798229 [Tanacetum coccineum]